ncbi:hypothetical protein C814_01705 [Anaerotruncus sp. G3(2012)]|nr:hypothetical protein C814_01705 [Anaerotruncus sp. G3(2012)]
MKNSQVANYADTVMIDQLHSIVRDSSNEG